MSPDGAVDFHGVSLLIAPIVISPSWALEYNSRGFSSVPTSFAVFFSSRRRSSSIRHMILRVPVLLLLLLFFFP